MQKKHPESATPKTVAQKCKKNNQTCKKYATSGFFLQNMHSSRICIFFRIFCIFLEFLQCFELWSSNRRPSQKCKKCTIPEFAFFSHLSFFIFIFIFAFSSRFFAKNAQFQNLHFCRIFLHVFRIFIVFFFFFCIFLVFSSSFLKFFNF